MVCYAILSVGSTNQRRCYYITPPLIGWVHTQNDPCFEIECSWAINVALGYIVVWESSGHWFRDCNFLSTFPHSNVHGAYMGPIWGRQDPDGPHVGPMHFSIWVSTLRPRQNVHHFGDSIFILNLLYENCCALLQISLRVFSKGPFTNATASVQIMACYQVANKLLSEPTKALWTAIYICSTRSWWVNLTVWSHRIATGHWPLGIVSY